MKMTRLMPALLMAVGMGATTTQAQGQNQSDSTGLPGDNFSLPGALQLFKKAGTPEEFEKLLNTEQSGVNNLDLNEDGNIDYVKVINKRENDVQIFVLQALVSEAESQDIAVIELEKNGKDNAVVQITGDEDIYGEEIIVEPEGSDDQAYLYSNSSIAHGPNMEMDAAAAAAGIVVNVWAWPCVRYVYTPAYAVWVSPWSWRARPVWWRPWRPLTWQAYRPVRYRFRPHYAVVHTRRVTYAPVMYKPMRVTSVTVTTRHRTSVANYRAAKVSRSTTVAHGPRGRAVRRTTTVEGPRGNKVSRSKTKVRRRR